MFWLVTSITVALISVPPKYKQTLISRSFPLEMSGEETTTLPMDGPTSGSVVNFAFGLLEV